MYSFVLSDGISDGSSGSLCEFKNELDQINALQLMVVADHWLGDYGGDASNAFYISNVKFVRLVPTTQPLPSWVTNHSAVFNIPKDLPQMAPRR